MKKFFPVMICICLLLSSCNTATLTKENYATALGSASQVCLDFVNSQEEQVAYNESKITLLPLSDSDFKDSDRTDIITACAWYMVFLKGVCLNDTYTLSDDMFDCYVDDGPSEYNIRFNMNQDPDTNHVQSSCYAYYLDLETVAYFEFDINYDFDNDKLLSFEVYLYLEDSEEYVAEDVYVFRYDGNVIKEARLGSETQTQAFNRLNSVLTSYENHTWGNDLPDFSEEYMAGYYATME